VRETRTAVVVMKPKPGQVEEVLRYAGVELRHEPSLRQLILHKNETVIGTFNEDDVARWYMEDA
jgi:hypothetical protein